jgi:hypothetical protein
LGKQRLANVHAHPRGTPGNCAESVQIDTIPKMLEKPYNPKTYVEVIEPSTGHI